MQVLDPPGLGLLSRLLLASLLTRRTARPARESDLLARSLDGVISEAWDRHYPAWTATTPLCDEHARSAVRRATPELNSLAAALRETDDADEVALLACRRLLCDGFASPLYSGRADDLRREAGRLRFRVLSSHGRG
jgi:hypothetical protein